MSIDHGSSTFDPTPFHRCSQLALHHFPWRSQCASLLSTELDQKYNSVNYQILKNHGKKCYYYFHKSFYDKSVLIKTFLIMCMQSRRISAGRHCTYIILYIYIDMYINIWNIKNVTLRKSNNRNKEREMLTLASVYSTQRRNSRKHLYGKIKHLQS